MKYKLIVNYYDHFGNLLDGEVYKTNNFTDAAKFYNQYVFKMAHQINLFSGDKCILWRTNGS